MILNAIINFITMTPGQYVGMAYDLFASCLLHFFIGYKNIT
jgi:hypothetical protein